MTNEIQMFNFNGNDIRVIDKGGQPWWVAKDVCDILELDVTSGARGLDDDEKGLHTMQTPGGIQQMSIVSEPGVYSLVLRSRKPEAKAFKRWITHEVIPAIRKHGGYLTPEKLEEALLSPDTLIRMLQEIKAEREKSAELSLQNARQAQIIHELKPKADYTDRILQNRGLVTITQIAKDYGMSGEAMNALLHELGVQYKQSDQWLLYAKYQSRGYTHSHTIDIVRSDGSPDVKMNTKWTQKGRLFLYDLLRMHGTLPMIERPEPATA